MGVSIGDSPDVESQVQDAGGGQSTLERGGGGPDSPGGGGQQLSAWAQPLGGWMAMADFVGDEDPEVADLMRSCGYVARAAVEEQAPELLDAILKEESFSQIPGYVRGRTHMALLDNLLPVPTSLAATEAREQLADLEKQRPRLLGGDKDVTTLAAQVINASPMLASETQRRNYHAEDARFWWATASLDTPTLLGTHHSSVYCQRPVHPSGDRTVATELTYVDRSFEALHNNNVAADHINDIYRPDIDSDRIPGFFESIDPELQHFFFVFRLLEQRRSRLQRRLGKIVEASKPAVSELVKGALTEARQTATAAMGPYAALVGPVLNLFEGLSAILLEHLLGVLQRSLADVNLPSWTISHTVACVPGYPPISIFLLSSLAAPGKRLHYYDSEDAQSDDSPRQTTSALRDDYSHHVRFHYSGRIMLGESQPTRPFPEQDLWARVAALGHPVTWCDSRSGFHVLVPQEEPGGDGHYVSALRADVRFSPEQSLHRQVSWEGYGPIGDL